MVVQPRHPKGSSIPFPSCTAQNGPSCEYGTFKPMARKESTKHTSLKRRLSLLAEQILGFNPASPALQSFTFTPLFTPPASQSHQVARAQKRAKISQHLNLWTPTHLRINPAARKCFCAAPQSRMHNPLAFTVGMSHGFFQQNIIGHPTLHQNTLLLLQRVAVDIDPISFFSQASPLSLREPRP